eukprot:TRINITY_DN4080_c0_g1_i1.p1 TRINITY_DN4080_c0_g1~~TRINITY_DN4080_c0_g1_i1.p1  ORF type:complete len:466 (+),score=156.71 TRINITY_DN4080_c0_g1_i1:121-1518(+)
MAVSPEVEQKIIHQIEYYFSPDNILRPDTFLIARLRCDDASVSISLRTIAEFRKVKDLSTDIDIIRAALLKSDVLKVSEVDSEYVLTATHLRPADCRVVSLLKAPEGTTESQIRDIFGPECAPTTVSCSKQVMWYCTFATEEEAKRGFEMADGYALGDSNLSARLKPEHFTYVREQDQQRAAQLQSGGRSKKAEKQVYLPEAMRPLLVGRKGENIKKLMEKFPTLEVDTRSDSTYVTLKAKNVSVLEEAEKDIQSFFRPPDAAQEPQQGLPQWADPVGGVMPQPVGMAGMGLPGMQQMPGFQGAAGATPPQQFPGMQQPPAGMYPGMVPGVLQQQLMAAAAQQRSLPQQQQQLQLLQAQLMRQQQFAQMQQPQVPQQQLLPQQLGLGFPGVGSVNPQLQLAHMQQMMLSQQQQMAGQAHAGRHGAQQPGGGGRPRNNRSGGRKRGAGNQQQHQQQQAAPAQEDEL